MMGKTHGKGPLLGSFPFRVPESYQFALSGLFPEGAESAARTMFGG